MKAILASLALVAIFTTSASAEVLRASEGMSAEKIGGCLTKKGFKEGKEWRINGGERGSEMFQVRDYLTTEELRRVHDCFVQPQRSSTERQHDRNADRD